MNPAIDVTTSVDSLQPREKLRCEGRRVDPGGGGVNVSRMIKELGGTSLAFVAVGGATGQKLLGMLEDASIDTVSFALDGSTRENFKVFETTANRQYRFVFPGPSQTAKIWQTALDQLRALSLRADYIVASGSLPPGVPDDFYARLSRAAGESNARLAVDTSGDALAAALEAGVYLVKPDQHELEQLTNGRVSTLREREDCARELVASGKAEVVAATFGSEGALAVWPQGHEWIRAPQVQVKSTVGAGDSFLGGMVFALADGKGVAEASEIAVAAGAAAVGSEGTALASRDDVYALLEGRHRVNRKRSGN